MGEARQRASKFIAEINEAEMACRIFEHMSGIVGRPRPYPTSPERSLEVVRATDPEVFARLQGATRAAMEYLRECIAKGQEPS